ncbi:MAG: DNA-binding response regulator, partial [Pedobacter sp.]
YALNGYDYNVIDYLLKPIEYDRFLKAALKADHIIKSVKDKLIFGENMSKKDFLFIKTDGKLIRVKYDEILFIEGKRDYISITTTIDKLISLDTLSNMESLLPATTFIRIHKSFIIALDKINFIQGNRVCINSDYLPIGDTYKNTLLKATKN